MKLRFGVSLVGCCSMALCMTLFIDGCKKSSPTIKTDSGADWTTYGRTNDEQRFGPLNQINEQNIGQLGLPLESRARHYSWTGSNAAGLEWRDLYDG